MEITAERESARGWLSWSSGKDSAFALHAARTDGSVDIVGLLTTVDEESDQVPVHGVPHALVRAQARALGLPLHIVELPWPCPNDVYEARTRVALAAAGRDGVGHLMFGDLFLRDVRDYRERLFAGSGVAPLFPLWGRPTAALAAAMVRSGLRAVISSVDPGQAPAGLVGRWFDERFLRELPAGIDPCGEHGEFHTFVVDGPGFAYPVDIAVGDAVQRDGLVVADLRPG